MTTEQNRILEMLSQGKINVEEAKRLLALVSRPRDVEESGGWRGRGGGRHPGRLGEMLQDKIREGIRERVRDGKESSAKYLRVVVEPVPGSSGSEWAQERANVRVPIAILRAGLRLGSIIPTSVADRLTERLLEKGIDLDLSRLTEGDISQLIDSLSDMEIDVQDVRHKVRVYVE